MTARALTTLVPLLLALVVAPAGAEQEPLGAHTQHPPKIIVLDNDHIQPSTLEMTGSDALVFENHSLHPIVVRFTEPADLKDRIRCGLIRRSDKERSQAPWQLFSWSDGSLVATIPPGRFASVCSLAAGGYTFLATREGLTVRPQAGAGSLPQKGQITVK
jgi:hypothetical protein